MRSCRLFPSFVTLLLLVSTQGKSQTKAPAFPLEVPLVDLPYNTKAPLSSPSMGQSLALTKDLYYAAHAGLETLVDPYTIGRQGFWSRMVFFAADGFVLTKLPFGQSWLHEEWHRAVMSNRGIASYNGVYTASPTSSLIAVSHESDEDLVMLKRDYPADQTRLAEAGMESEHALVRSVEADHFFQRTATYDQGLLWFGQLSPIFYMNECNSPSRADAATDAQNERDGDQIEPRDFTGLDCLGWVYDLHRPTEPFEARGKHPSNVGIDRYTKHSDLNDDEKKFLNKQAMLSWINLIDPFMFRKERHASSYGAWNVAMRHDLTPFGFAVAAQGFLDGPFGKYMGSIQGFWNRDRAFPGIELERVEMPLGEWLISPRLALWQQPKALSFYDDTAVGGGYAGIKIETIFGQRWRPYLDLEGKTQGWAPGRVELGRSFRTQGGITVAL